MNNYKQIPLSLAITLLAVTAAEARGPIARPWMVYPAKAIDACQSGTASASYADRCGDLLDAYSREIRSCAPRRFPAEAPDDQHAAYAACAAFAARNAAGLVK